MFIFIIIIHVIASLILIAVILFQAGRGDMADTFGGGTATKFLGTGAATFLSRATTVCATIFILTSLTLAILSSRASRSLIDQTPSAKMEEKQKDEAPKPQ